MGNGPQTADKDHLRAVQSEIVSEPLTHGLSHWCALRAGRRMPRRRDFEPSETPRLLPHVLLVEVRAPVEFHFRLVGNHIAERIDARSGMALTDLPAEQGQARLREILGTCVERQHPILDRYGIEQHGLHERQAEILCCPFSDDDESVNLVMCFLADLGLSRKADGAE